MANGSRLSIAITPNGGQSGPSPAPQDCLNRNLAFSRKRARRAGRRRTLRVSTLGWGGVGRDTKPRHYRRRHGGMLLPFGAGAAVRTNATAPLRNRQRPFNYRLEGPRGGVVTQRSANSLTGVPSCSVLSPHVLNCLRNFGSPLRLVLARIASCY